MTLGRQSTALEVVQHFGSNLSGKTAVITGGNSGIGLETAKALASAGCSVVLCCRNVAAAKDAVAHEIRGEGASGYTVPEAQVEVVEIDLADLTSVTKGASAVMDLVDRIDFLLLNAGVFAVPQQYSAQGFEMHMAVNHYGHFHLTQLLLPLMQSQPHRSRVVSVASVAHESLPFINTRNLHFRNGRPYIPWAAYGQSKLANVLFSRGLQARLDADPANKISTAAIHPGIIGTPLWNNNWSVITDFLLPRFLADKSVAQGASTLVYACLAPSLPRAAYLENCAVSRSSWLSRRSALADDLWEVTARDIREALPPSERPPPRQLETPGPGPQAGRSA